MSPYNCIKCEYFEFRQHYYTDKDPYMSLPYNRLMAILDQYICALTNRFEYVCVSMCVYVHVCVSVFVRKHVFIEYNKSSVVQTNASDYDIYMQVYA